MLKIKKLIVMSAACAALFVFPAGLRADEISQRQTFFVNAKYDEFNRTTVNATLRHISQRAYFYVDDRFWSGLSAFGQNKITEAISELAREFDNNIYPESVAYWGAAPNPGVDGDSRVTVLLEDLVATAGGYFDGINNYRREEASDSNQREMVYISADSLAPALAKEFLAHEFQHLISSNQKEIQKGLSEEVWLNETRSEYAGAITSYDSESASGGVLSRRISIFKSSPSDSLIEWPNVATDYAQAALLGRYISGHYENILAETIKSNSIGIASINEFLARRGNTERFENIFANWTVANYINSASTNPKFSYTQEYLKDIQINPSRVTNITAGSDHSFSYSLEPWRAYWHKINVDSSETRAIKISFDPSLYKITYIDNLERNGFISNPGYITNPGGLQNFTLIPFHASVGSQNLTIKMAYTDEQPAAMFGPELKDGALIHKQGEPELYVIEGRYKRYLRPEVIRMYGHLDPNRAIALDAKTFDSYMSTNYVRYANDQKVYAVWPDGTKHWLQMSAKTFTDSGRDWNSIFIINDLELNAYQTSTPITR